MISLDEVKLKNVYVKATCGLVTVLFSLLTLSLCQPAHAGKKEESKKHFEAGVALRKAEDYAAAAVEFEESAKIFRTKGALFNLANCYKALHRYAEALATLKLLEGTFKGKLGKEMRDAVTHLKKEIRSMTGQLDVRVNMDGARVLVDGEQVGTSPLTNSLLLAPGYRDVRVEKDGMEVFEQKVRIVSRSKATVLADLVPAKAAPATVPGGESDFSPDHGGTDGNGNDYVEVSSSEDTKDGKSPLLLGLSIGSTAITVGLGAVAGVFWAKKANSESDYNSYLGLYDDLDPASSAYDYDEEEMRIFTKLEGAQDDVNANRKSAVGFTIGAGAMAAASVVLWVLYARSGKGDETADTISLCPAPGGLVLAF